MSSFTDLPSALVNQLARAGLDPRRVHDDVAAAVAEDLPGEDVTSAATLDPTQVAWADLVARAPGVVAGLPVAEVVFHHVVGASRGGQAGRSRRRPGAARRRAAVGRTVR